MISKATLVKGLNALAAVTGRVLTEEHYGTYLQALREMNDAEFARAVDALARSWSENRMPPPAAIIVAGSAQPKAVAAADAAQTFNRLLWSYVDRTSEGQNVYCEAATLRDLGARAVLALRAIGGSARLNLALADIEERKWALREFQSAMNETNERDARLALGQVHRASVGRIAGAGPTHIAEIEAHGP